jgi:hypothetical protein
MATEILHPKNSAISLHEQESMLERISSNAVRIMLMKKLYPTKKDEGSSGAYRGSSDKSVTACVVQQPTSEEKLVSLADIRSFANPCKQRI